MRIEHEREVRISTPSIRLDQFLKWAGVAPTGGKAKEMIAGGRIRVNGVVESRRSTGLRPGDVVEVDSGPAATGRIRVVGAP